MKIYIGLIVLLTLFISSCGSDSSVSDPEDVGPQVMDLLEDLGDLSKEDFRDYFMTLEEVRELGENEDVIKDEDGRNRLTKMTKEDRDKELDRSFSRLIETGSELGIKWSEVEMDDFAYEVETKRGIKSCRGELTFKHGSDKFVVRTISIFDGSDYCLVEVGRPRKK